MDEEKIKLFREGVDGLPYEVKLKNPGTDGIEDFLKVMGEMAGMIPPDFTGKTKEERVALEKEHFAKSFQGMTDGGRKALKNLVLLSLKKTYPDFTDDDDQWGMNNFMNIFPVVIEMCSPKDREAIKKAEVIDRVKELQRT